MIDELLAFGHINRLKSVQRASSVDERKESAAEHTWSSMMLADFFFDKVQPLDRLKVFELLLYHDVAEIQAGDTPLAPKAHDDTKEAREEKAAQCLKEKLPMGDRFFDLFNEYEALQTPEAKFACAINKLDVIIQEIDYKTDWKGWSKQFLLEKKLPFMEPFPALKDALLVLVDYLEKEGYFDQ